MVALLFAWEDVGLAYQLFVEMTLLSGMADCLPKPGFYWFFFAYLIVELHNLFIVGGLAFL